MGLIFFEFWKVFKIPGHYEIYEIRQIRSNFLKTLRKLCVWLMKKSFFGTNKIWKNEVQKQGLKFSAAQVKF